MNWKFWQSRSKEVLPKAFSVTVDYRPDLQDAVIRRKIKEMLPRFFPSSEISDLMLEILYSKEILNVNSKPILVLKEYLFEMTKGPSVDGDYVAALFEFGTRNILTETVREERLKVGS